MAQLVIVADDLTGAADTGASFADAGYATVIPLGGAAFPEADVLVLSTESRDRDAETATATVGAAIAQLWSVEETGRPRWIYKKIDSALRGHPRDELLAAMDATGETRTVVAPALPSEGRTTLGGRQLIGGMPLEFSSFGAPGATSELGKVFTNTRGLPVELLDRETLLHRQDAVLNLLASPAPGIVVADAQSDADLAELSRLISKSRLRLLCGAAGFARQLAPLLPLVPSTIAPIQVKQSDAPILVVAGSRHEATARQIALLITAGALLVRLDQAHLDDPSCGVDEIVLEVASHLASGRATVVTTAGLPPSAIGARSVAARLAEIAAAPAILDQTGGLVLTGGDVAAAVCAALGATALRLGGEIYAGQPWAVLEGGVLPNLAVATKAGSFGRDDALFACINHLERQIGQG